MILQLENISKTFPNKNLFEKVNLRVEAGERLALVGENGAGKTTLLNIICGEESADSGDVVLARDVSLGYLKQEAIEMQDRKIFDEVIASQRFILDLQDEIEELEAKMASGIDIDMQQYGQKRDKFDAMDGYSLKSKVNSVLFGLGFSEADLQRKTSEFSGGWQMRIALSKLLVKNPDLLLLDEPTNHLDLESVAWLEQFLGNYPGSIIVVSHDRAFMDNIVTRVAEVANGSLYQYKGDYSNYVKQRDNYINQLKAKRTRQLEEMHRLEVFVERFRYKATKARQAQERAARLEKLKEQLIEIPHQRKTVHFHFEQPPRTGDMVVNCVNISKRFDEKVIYDNENFKIYRGDKIALVGPNGAGKSTLLKMIAGVLKPDSGKVKYGVHVSHMYYAQHQLDELNESKTVYEELEKVAPG